MTEIARFPTNEKKTWC